ncbi:TetR family transcriptional regulator [Acrocarpospora corrugata]|uniref:TetR family transcriptional regulator n=1 Tax=Acrocarpospora corrugata TaxID=35763 RepID=A0A5M3VPM1_9ACTN|nr:TetR/AcrR family transcriptional regulator [Acrocarpospora corrugata]GER98734.1 TetR family transcriptional regulator [Acrocarpospora corrugata]
MAAERARPLRADAQANQDRILEAAARAFTRDGADASLKGIAQEAGVGIGTLYRRFPTREDLIEALYRNQTAALCDAATSLLDANPPALALRTWMDRFVDYVATKHGMAEALQAVLATHNDLRMRTRGMLGDAVARLVRAGVAAGTIRADIDTADVLMALSGVTLVAGEPAQRDQAARLLDLLMAGLEPRGPQPGE